MRKTARFSGYQRIWLAACGYLGILSNFESRWESFMSRLKPSESVKGHIFKRWKYFCIHSLRRNSAYPIHRSIYFPSSVQDLSIFAKTFVLQFKLTCFVSIVCYEKDGSYCEQKPIPFRTWTRSSHANWLGSKTTSSGFQDLRLPGSWGRFGWRFRLQYFVGKSYDQENWKILRGKSCPLSNCNILSPFQWLDINLAWELSEIIANFSIRFCR